MSLCLDKSNKIERKFKHLRALINNSSEYSKREHPDYFLILKETNI